MLLTSAPGWGEACARSVRTFHRPAGLLAAMPPTPALGGGEGELVGRPGSLQQALARCELDFAVMSRPGEAEGFGAMGTIGPYGFRLPSAGMSGCWPHSSRP